MWSLTVLTQCAHKQTNTHAHTHLIEAKIIASQSLVICHLVFYFRCDHFQIHFIGVMMSSANHKAR